MDDEIKFAQTYWCVADLRNELEEQSEMWTTQKCEEFLSEIEEEIKDEMIQAGRRVLENRVAKAL